MLAAFVAALFVASAAADSALWLGADSAAFLGHGEPLSAASNAHAAAALLGLHPVGPVTAAQSDELNSLLSPSVLARPATLLSVQLLGVSAEAVERSWPAGGGELASRPLLGSSAEVAAALATLPARPLAAQCDAVCDAACLERELGDGGASLKALDEGLSSQLACLLHAARAQAAAAPAGSGLLSASLAASKQPSDADAEAVARTLAAALAALQAGRPGAATAQLTVLDEMGATRELLTAPSPAPAPPAGAMRPITLTQWDGRVASVGVGVLLLTAITGTVIALCTMPLGQDSLLFTRTKGD